MNSSAGQEAARADIKQGLVLDLHASDYTLGSSTWVNRVANQADANVPSTVGFDVSEGAFLFSAGGDVITVPLATSGTAMQEASFVLWAKLPHEIPTGNLGWVVSQFPDYVWSRALTLKDWRLGQVSITTARYWDSKLGSPPVGEWIHLAGVWRHYEPSTAYMNGIPGESTDANNGRGSDPHEVLVIGGRAPGDPVHNPAIAISQVRVYNRALRDSEVLELFKQGQQRSCSPQVTDCRMKKTPSKSRVVIQYCAQLPPRLDEKSGLFWCATGVTASDIPEARAWQQEFRAKVAELKPATNTRMLKMQVSDAPTPAKGIDSSKPRRVLMSHPSDPEKRAHRAAHSSALQHMKQKPGFALLVGGRKVSLFRFTEKIFAVDAECPHQGGPLAEGEVGDIEDMVLGTRCYVTCPVHKFQFDLTSGAVIHGKCETLATYPVRFGRLDDSTKEPIIEVGFQSLGEDFFGESEDLDF